MLYIPVKKDKVGEGGSMDGRAVEGGEALGMNGADGAADGAVELGAKILLMIICLIRNSQDGT